MLKVKFSYPYPDWPVMRQTPGSEGVWGNYKFYLNDEIEECDYWVVFNFLPSHNEATFCAPENTILLTGEPYVLQRYIPRFLRQFSHVITCQKEISHPGKFYFHQGHPWFVNKSYDELTGLNDIPKNKQISIVTSNKQLTEGHRKRYEFAMALKEHFGEAIDLFGRGIRDFDDKWEVLAPYKYSIAIENFVCDHWITEKLYDCYLANTFPLYYGSPNVHEYFSKDSLLNIDINDFEKSKRAIESVLNDSSHYEKHLQQLKEAKLTYLNNYNIFPLIVNYIESQKLSPGKKKHITLSKNFSDPVSMLHRIKNKFLV